MPDSDFMDKILERVKTALKIKKIMLKKNLTRARCKCPHCQDGMINATLAGPKKHIHARCSTPECTVFME